jgi:hypothetical protein
MAKAAVLTKRRKPEEFEKEGKQGKKPSLEAWKQEEMTEEDHPRHRDKAEDFINDAVGSKFYSPNYSERWNTPALGFFKVTRYYHHQKVAYDQPITVKEKEVKAEFFKGKGIKYVALNPGEAVDADKFFEMVQNILRG